MHSWPTAGRHRLGAGDREGLVDLDDAVVAAARDVQGAAVEREDSRAECAGVPNADGAARLDGRSAGILIGSSKVESSADHDEAGHVVRAAFWRTLADRIVS